jgi:hypothetical protein
MMPRHHAAIIATLPTREERRSALDQVPAEWRELIAKHVQIAFDRKNKLATRPRLR